MLKKVSLSERNILMKRFVYSYTACRVSAFGIFLVRIFLHSDWYSPYSVRIRENTNEKNCEYRNFSRSAILTIVHWYETSVTAYHHKKLKTLKTESLSVPSKDDYESGYQYLLEKSGNPRWSFRNDNTLWLC